MKNKNEIKQIDNHLNNLEEYKSLLEAIFLSTQDAISVVNNQGEHIMVNPAYTKITGINTDEILGKGAQYDVSEGESVHLKVLETKSAIEGATLKLKPTGKIVIAQASPIIVNNKLIGSVAGLKDVTEINKLNDKLQDAKKKIRQLSAKYIFDDIVGESKVFLEAKLQAQKAAKLPVTVLLRGESGTGKELFAHAIHAQSDRKNKQFIRINCAALPESLIESELFGYVEGAFTGAKKGGKKGMFEEANKGTIFLDEISEINLNTQVKLLRVLQEKEINRVGSPISIPVDVRIIAATNMNLEQAVRNGKFREDLYYRLNIFPINIPPLKQRKDDIPLLANEFIKKFNYEYGRNIRGIEEQAIHKLMEYTWPGNVRELENYIGRCIINTSFSEQIIKKSNLPQQDMRSNGEYIFKEIPNEEIKRLDEYIEKVEVEYLRNVLNSVNNNKTEAAKKLGISIRSLYYKLDKYGIDYNLL